MDNKNFIHIHNSPSISANSDTHIANSSNLFVHSPTVNTSTTTLSLQTLQPVPVIRSVQVYSDNNTKNGSNIVITQPTFKKLLGESIKQEQVEDQRIHDEYSTTKNKLTTNQSKLSHIQPPTVITSTNLNSRETINGLSNISMANVGAHIISPLNPAHLPDATGNYFVPNMQNDLASNYKLHPSSNSDLPSPSNSSTSSNPPSSNHHQQGKGHDPGRKREMRLQKNREAARECRRKKKEYIKCLEERVTGLENQNKALIEELRQLKELYCQRDETNNNPNNKTTR